MKRVCGLGVSQRYCFCERQKREVPKPNQASSRQCPVGSTAGYIHKTQVRQGHHRVRVLKERIAKASLHQCLFILAQFNQYVIGCFRVKKNNSFIVGTVFWFI